ncbi:hypothetical protein K435DRAFT_787004 [Dendrothele bispora CBS 962.96]|uniref:Protein kinase domain-containing protein n=1 Tax=Dendrothele bispora (strain CBS 962.96) TaxID=1314807 RepID=A0A4S8KMW2_DENBC|nr:hypothetical protein K435DRAFT_787004 [Dendrothele bispora CBS 962.96]
MTADPAIAAASLNLFELEQPFQCTNEDGELFAELDTDRIRQLSTVPRKVLEQASSLFNLDEIIVKEDQGPPYTTRYLISRKTYCQKSSSTPDSSKKKKSPNSQSNDKASSSNTKQPGSTHTTIVRPILYKPEVTLLEDLSEHVRLNNTQFLTRDFLHLPIYSPELVGNDVYKGIYRDAVRIKIANFCGKELEIAIQVLDCVCVLHTLKVAHLDINVPNFVWDKDSSSVKLSHFALARKCPDPDAKISGPVGILVPPIALDEYNPYHVDNYATGLVVAYLLEDAVPEAPEDLDPIQFLVEKANCMIRERTWGPEQVLQEFRARYDRFGIKPRPSLGPSSVH